MSLDSYPTDEELAQVKSLAEGYPATSESLLSLVKSLWWPDGDYGFKLYEKQGVPLLDLDTWGWSGNESIIDALERTAFWWLSWENIRRGGHYTFELKEQSDG